MSTKPPAPQPDNVLPFLQTKQREREPTRSLDTRTAATQNKMVVVTDVKEGHAPPYAPPPGETFGLFKVNELEAGELLQILNKPPTAAFIILRGTVEELVRNTSGPPIVVREIEAGELLNASLFMQGVDLSGTEVALRAKTDMLFYVVTPDDIEAYDVAEELRAGVRHKRDRCVNEARAQNHIGLLRNRNAAAVAAAGWQTKAEELNRILHETLQARVAEIVATQIKPIRDENAALREENEHLRKDREAEIAELERLRKDRVADADSMRIMLEEVDTLINTEVKDEHEKRLAVLIAIVLEALLMMSTSNEPGHAQKAVSAMSEMGTFKMKPPKEFLSK
jgi:hypothetical protein